MIAVVRGTCAAACTIVLARAGAPAIAQPASGHGQMTSSQASPASQYKVGSLVITAPWIRATPKGAPVAGGYLTITNNGSEPDRLIGVSLAAAAKFEVHEMSMDGGVMKMRPLADGLEIKPGQTVELSPGGYHIMFPGLKRQLRQGETVKGTLEFAKAGRVEITYQVGAMGGGAPGMEMHHH
jgi:copper(I)-binding protein